MLRLATRALRSGQLGARYARSHAHNAQLNYARVMLHSAEQRAGYATLACSTLGFSTLGFSTLGFSTLARRALRSGFSTLARRALRSAELRARKAWLNYTRITLGFTTRALCYAQQRARYALGSYTRVTLGFVMRTYDMCGLHGDVCVRGHVQHSNRRGSWRT